MLPAILVLILLLALYSWLVEPEALRIREVTVPSLGGVSGRFVLLTDLHLGRFTSAPRLIRKLARLRSYLRERPADILLLGGDYLDCDARYLPDLELVLKELAAFGLPTYAVLGNHDYLSCQPVVPLVAALEAAGCAVLRNSAARLTLSGGELLLVGTDDLEQAPGYRQGLRYLSDGQYRQLVGNLDWYSRFEEDLPRLLLSHNPDGAYLPGPPPLAVLSGHTHGGQLVPVDLLGRHATRLVHYLLPAGSFRTEAGSLICNGRRLLISRGLGGSAIPARFLRPPEAIIVELK